MLGRQRAIEIIPGSKPFRWRRYDVPQHLAPETGDALWFRAVEGDLELLDRCHQSTIDRPYQVPHASAGAGSRGGVRNAGGAVRSSAPSGEVAAASRRVD